MQTKRTDSRVLKLQERLAEGKLRINYYYKNKLKLQEKKQNVNAKATMFTLTTEFSCTLISFKILNIVNNYTYIGKTKLTRRLDYGNPNQI